MYIGDFFKKRQPVVSFEIFPPKQTSSFESIVNTTKQLSLLSQILLVSPMVLEVLLSGIL